MCNTRDFIFSMYVIYCVAILFLIDWEAWMSVCIHSCLCGCKVRPACNCLSDLISLLFLCCMHQYLKCHRFLVCLHRPSPYSFFYSQLLLFIFGFWLFCVNLKINLLFCSEENLASILLELHRMEDLVCVTFSLQSDVTSIHSRIFEMEYTFKMTLLGRTGWYFHKNG